MPKTPITTNLVSSGFLKLSLAAIALSAIAESIGAVRLPLGVAEVALLPMIWALLLGLFFVVLTQKLAAPLKVTTKEQYTASAMIQIAALIFIARLGLDVGSQLHSLANAGWGLMLQELGNLIGCIFLAMPVALLLGIKKEAIGSTFSVGREPSLGIIAEKFGMHSPQGHGVLAEYLTGTLFGAAFMSIFVSLVASLKIFNPLALAMGAGIGSGSMTAAAMAAVIEHSPADAAGQIRAISAASNLIASTFGVYLAVFISLPLACWLYNKLEPILGKNKRYTSVNFDSQDSAALGHTTNLGWRGEILTIIVIGIMVLLNNKLGYGKDILPAIAAMVIIGAIVLAAKLIYVLVGRRMPLICWVTLVGMCLGLPFFERYISTYLAAIEFKAMLAPMLMFAGLSIYKDLPIFRKLGWRIVVVSLLASAGVFLLSTIIAQPFVGKI